MQFIRAIAERVSIVQKAQLYIEIKMFIYNIINPVLSTVGSRMHDKMTAIVS